MELFNWLLVGHLVGDFILQTRWMAEKKTQNFWALVVHSFVYTVSVAFIALAAKGLSWQGITLIFIGHLALDNRKFLDFWGEHVNGNKDIGWLKITLDQSWHVVILAIATLI